LEKGAYKDITDPAKLAYKLESDIRVIHDDSHFHVNFEPGLFASKMMSPEEMAKAMKELLNKNRWPDAPYARLFTHDRLF
jgi:hypothetical protein